MPRYPNEVLPLFLYVGDRSHACNASMNYDLKINSHVNMIADLATPYPGTINELHVEVEDKEDADLLARFEEIYLYMGTFTFLITIGYYNCIYACMLLAIFMSRLRLLKINKCPMQFNIQ